LYIGLGGVLNGMKWGGWAFIRPEKMRKALLIEWVQ
jgi:hypothetical protein